MFLASVQLMFCGLPPFQKKEGYFCWKITSLLLITGLWPKHSLEIFKWPFFNKMFLYTNTKWLQLLSDFTQTWIWLVNFSKNPVLDLTKIHSLTANVFHLYSSQMFFKHTSKQQANCTTNNCSVFPSISGKIFTYFGQMLWQILLLLQYLWGCSKVLRLRSSCLWGAQSGKSHSL